MDNITLADIRTWIGFLAALIGSCTGIYVWIKKLLKALFDAQTKDIHEQLAKNREMVIRVDLENCKNFLVSFLARCDKQGCVIDEIEKARFWEQYEHYLELGGNSYIRNRVEQLRKDGKL